MSSILLYETQREVMHLIGTKDEQVLRHLYPLHLVLVYDHHTNEEMVYYLVYAKYWYYARHTAREHFQQNFPLSSLDCNWKVDSVEIN